MDIEVPVVQVQAMILRTKDTKSMVDMVDSEEIKGSKVVCNSKEVLEDKDNGDPIQICYS